MESTDNDVGGPEDEPIVVKEVNYCLDYMDEYHVTLTSFGPNPNRVRQYLRQRFVYSLEEVLKIQVPVPLLVSVYEGDAEMVRVELEGLGAEVQVTCEPGGPERPGYPRVRIPFYSKIGA